MAGVGGDLPAFVQVRAPRGPFRRAGLAFDKGFTLFEDGDLDASQLETLVREPMLEVQASDDGERFVTIEPADVPESAIADGERAGFTDDEIDELTSENEALRSEVVSLRERVESAGTQVADLIRDRDALSGKVTDLDQDKADQAKLIEGLKAQLVEATDRATAAETALAERKPADPVPPAKPAKPAKSAK